VTLELGKQLGELVGRTPVSDEPSTVLSMCRATAACRSRRTARGKVA
jgi:hypothetical protein